MELTQHDASSWSRAVEALLPSVHEVDRAATRIWFHFFPLALADAVERADDAAQLELALRLEGAYRLTEQADVSHRFLYGHRYWSSVTAAILATVEATPPPTGDLADVIRALARRAAAAAATTTATDGADESLVLGITAVGLMTLRQVGVDAFRQLGRRSQPRTLAATRTPTERTPAEVVAARQKDDSQGLLGMFRGANTRYSVTFDERRPDARFTVINQQHLTTAAATDTRAYASNRGVPYAGPIPAQCRSGSCGTCWIGVLGGAEKLSEVDRLEARRLRECGYLDAAAGTPHIRLACMARASGNVTIAIPPWNGFLGTPPSANPPQA